MRSSNNPQKSITLSEKSKQQLSANAPLLIRSLVEAFTLDPGYFLKFLTRLENDKSFNGRLFKDIGLKGGQHIASESAVYAAIENSHELINDYVASMKDMSIVIDEEHFNFIRKNVNTIFNVIAENSRWKAIFEGQADPSLSLSPEEKQMAEQIAKLSVEERHIMRERIAGAFVFMVQGFAFKKELLSAANISFAGPIINLLFPDVNQYLAAEKDNKIAKSIDQAFNVAEYVARVKNNNIDLLSTFRDNLVFGIEQLFTQDPNSSHSRRLAFESLGEQGHLELNKKLLDLCTQLAALPDSAQKKQALQSAMDAIHEHYNAHYKDKQLSPVVAKSLRETSDNLAELNKDTTKDFEKLSERFAKQDPSIEKKGFFDKINFFAKKDKPKSPEQTGTPVPSAPKAKQAEIDAAIASWQSGSETPTGGRTKAAIIGKSDGNASPTSSSSKLNTSPDGSDSDKSGASSPMAAASSTTPPPDSEKQVRYQKR